MSRPYIQAKLHDEMVRQFQHGRALQLFTAWKVGIATSQSYKIATTSRRAISAMYDAEYGGMTANYAYLNLLLCPDGLEQVTASPRFSLSNDAQIVDVGAGSGELLRYLHHERRIGSERLHGCDLSARSCDIIRRDGFTPHLGRLEEVGLCDDAFDVVFLSYFVDYDTDQRATFDAAIRAVRRSGRIVFEGCLPSRPAGLLRSERSKCTFVTRGGSEMEDAELICQYVQQRGEQEGKPVSDINILSAERYLFNRRGLRKLPSTFITFSF